MIDWNSCIIRTTTYVACVNASCCPRQTRAPPLKLGECYCQLNPLVSMRREHSRNIPPSRPQLRVLPAVGAVVFGVGAEGLLGSVERVDVVVDLLARFDENGVFAFGSAALWQSGVAIRGPQIKRQRGEETQSCELLLSTQIIQTEKRERRTIHTFIEQTPNLFEIVQALEIR